MNKSLFRINTASELAETLLDECRKSVNGFALYIDNGILRTLRCESAPYQKFMARGAPGLLGVYRMTVYVRPKLMLQWLTEDAEHLFETFAPDV